MFPPWLVPLLLASQPGGGLAADSLHAHPRVVCEAPALAPGDTTEVGILFRIDPGWHLYWNGWNDSGLPPTVVADLPAGFTMGEIRWPAPHQKFYPGDILDHVYEKEVMLLVPIVRGREGALPATLRFKLDWLACSDFCIAESARVSIQLPCAADDGEAASLLERWRARVPIPMPRLAPLLLKWKGDTLSVRTRGRAATLLFYPFADCSPIEEPLLNTFTVRPPLLLPFAREEGDTIRARGVVEVRRDGEDPVWFSIDGAATPSGPRRRPERK